MHLGFCAFGVTVNQNSLQNYWQSCIRLDDEINSMSDEFSIFGLGQAKRGLCWLIKKVKAQTGRDGIMINYSVL